MVQQSEAILKSALNCPHRVKNIRPSSNNFRHSSHSPQQQWCFLSEASKTISQMPPVIYKVTVVADLHLLAMLDALKACPTCMKRVCLEEAGEWGWTDLLFVLIRANVAATYQKITTLVNENQQQLCMLCNKSQLWGEFSVNHCSFSCSSLLLGVVCVSPVLHLCIGPCFFW